MTQQERDLLCQLAANQERAWEELRAMQTVLLAALHTISTDDASIPVFVSALQYQLEQRDAVTNASPVPDEKLAQADAVLKRYIPAHIQPLIRMR